MFIDSRVSNLSALMAGYAADAQVVLLDAAQDGIAQMAQALEGATSVEAIHVVSHGADGMLYLGNTLLHSDNLLQYASQLADIGASLTASGDILLYGCDVAATLVGQQFIKQLSNLIGADVAASTDATGASALGGNWQLEAATGSIEAGLLAAPAYTGLLDIINGTAGSDNLVGTTNNDVLTGFGGIDTLDGGAGFDIAIYSGNTAGYNFSVNSGRVVISVINPANGDDGTDVLISVEAAQFTDGQVRIGSVANALSANEKPFASTGLTEGGYVVLKYGQAANSTNLYGQRYDANGTSVGGEFSVNTLSGGAFDPALTALTDGGFVAVWRYNAAPDGSGTGIFAQRFSADGAAVGNEFRVNSTPIPLMLPRLYSYAYPESVTEHLYGGIGQR